MTREEAIKILRREIECLSHTKCEDCILEAACDPARTTPFDSEYIEVYEMAIKALEQTDCGKCEYLVYDEVFDEETGDEYDASYCRKQEPCEDCISRAEAIKALEYDLSIEADGGLDKYRTVIKDLLNAIYNTQKKAIEDLPSVQPKPKTGHWIISPNDCFVSCSECGLHGDKGIYKHYRWCPNCGAKMVETQKSEDKECR